MKWTPTPANINALPDGVRQYVHDLETLCDPAHIIAENTLLRDEVKMLASIRRMKMSEPTIIMMGLTKKAKSKGGDRYDGELASGEKINIYVPQEISRNTMDDEPSEGIELKLTLLG